MSLLPAISVVVPTYNRADTLRQCLESLVGQDYAGPTEIVVVDDGSTDGTPQVSETFSGLIYLRQANQGPAAARNHGIATAMSEIIAFTDDDCLAPPNWLSVIAGGYRRYPEVAGVGGYLEAPAHILSDNLLAQFERSVGLDEYGAGDEERVGGFDCPAGGTNNMSYRRQILLDVGGFDETFPYAAGEDADLKLRITQRGAKLLYIPVKVTHLQPYTWAAFCRQQLTRGRGVVHFERKHVGHPPSRLRVLLRLAKRAALIAPDLLSGTRRPLAFIRFAAKWYDGVGQLQEVRRLARSSG